MHRLVWLLPVVAGCSFTLDFDDLENLPCPCAPGFVCLQASNRCVPNGSSEPFKSCSLDTPLTGDELCPSGHRCVAVNNQGPRCLPQCQPVLYARPEAGARVAAQCDFGTTCWDTAKGGVCSEGVCRDNPNDCPNPGERCVVFNGAGVCFTTCTVKFSQPFDCIGDQICHPIGLTNITACVNSGTLAAGTVCTSPEDGMCEQTDAMNRPLICAGFEASTNEQLFCRPVCDVSTGVPCLPGETCPLVRARIDPTTGTSLGACTN